MMALEYGDLVTEMNRAGKKRSAHSDLGGGRHTRIENSENKIKHIGFPSNLAIRLEDSRTI